MKAQCASACGLVFLCALAHEQNAPQGATARASPPTFRLQLFTQDVDGELLPSQATKIHVTRLDPDFVTDNKGFATAKLLPGTYTLTAITEQLCHFTFTVESGKDLDLKLITLADDFGNCVKVHREPPRPHAPASSASSP